jgi:alcohol dehydrogenase (cytochrome c)
MRIRMVACLGLLACPVVAAAQSNGGAASTSHGVYTREQALRGADVYAGNCRSCHTPESHTAAQFVTRWNGRTLLELYTYIHDQMPKNDPGTLTAEEYVDVMAYLLRMNRSPVGASELNADTLALKAIRIDIGKSP